jgi:hypothetical protein
MQLTIPYRTPSVSPFKRSTSRAIRGGPSRRTSDSENQRIQTASTSCVVTAPALRRMRTRSIASISYSSDGAPPGEPGSRPYGSTSPRTANTPARVFLYVAVPALMPQQSLGPSRPVTDRLSGRLGKDQVGNIAHCIIGHVRVVADPLAGMQTAASPQSRDLRPCLRSLSSFDSLLPCQEQKHGEKHRLSGQHCRC